MSSVASAHQNGCHRWHSCPSDSGTYVCGDFGHACQYPTYPGNGHGISPLLPGHLSLGDGLGPDPTPSSWTLIAAEWPNYLIGGLVMLGIWAIPSPQKRRDQQLVASHAERLDGFSHEGSGLSEDDSAHRTDRTSDFVSVSDREYDIAVATINMVSPLTLANSTHTATQTTTTDAVDRVGQKTSRPAANIGAPPQAIRNPPRKPSPY